MGSEVRYTWGPGFDWCIVREQAENKDGIQFQRSGPVLVAVLVITDVNQEPVTRTATQRSYGT